MQYVESGAILLLTVFEYLSFFYTFFEKRRFRKKTIRDLPVTAALLVSFFLAITRCHRLSQLLIAGMILGAFCIYFFLVIDFKTFFQLFIVAFPILEIAGSLIRYICNIAGVRDDIGKTVLTLAIIVSMIWGLYVTKLKQMLPNSFILPLKFNCIYAMLLFVITVLYSFFTSFIEKNYTGHILWLGQILLVLGGIIILYSSFFIIYYINAKRRSDYERFVTEKYIEQQRIYFEQLLEKEKETRQYRHDTIAQLVQIQYYLEHQEIHTARSFTREMLDEITNISRQNIDIGNEIVNTMLNYYLAPLKARKYKINIKGFMKEELQVSGRDLCIIVSNLLKNAVEAVEVMNPDEGFIDIEIYSRQTTWYMKVINSTSNQQISATTKADTENHGFGLSNIRRSVEKYEGLFHTNIKDGVFTAEVWLRA